uniref:Indoleamine 2,3-dioxygenase 1 n=1 Tax=Lepisosteus oculatus TaxID=7918 RepID=W5NCY9_LEPOC|nr:PREDICTED: indoleamine 2,3-dioxygenase 2-like isoform X1 [Lepisosteus oculatus]
MASSPRDQHHPGPFSLNKYHVSEEYGFVLPAPLTDLPQYYQPWMQIARQLTELIDSHSLRSEVHKMPQLDTCYLQTHRELRLAHLALSLLTMGYVWQEGEEGTVKVLPQNLAVPYWEVSQRLGLPPILTHADGVLANWRKTNPEGPFEMENLELILTLPGGDSVRGFFLVTLLVELAAVPGVKAIPRMINSMLQQDKQTVQAGLNDITQALKNMTDAIRLMHAHVDPAVFYGIMRLYLSGWKDNPLMAEGLVYEGVRTEPLQYSGGSAAQSSLLHCFDELLGVQHEPESGAFLTRMRDYMPPMHKQLVQDISSGPSLRQYVLDAADPQLTQAFSTCVSQLLSLRSYHINIVSRFITIPAARARQLKNRSEGPAEALSRAPVALEERGTGGSGIMNFLKSVRDRTKEVSIPPATL